MVRQTRSSTSNSPTKAKPATKVVLPLYDEDPYKVYILPDNASAEANFVFLKNPRDGIRSQYFFCPNQGLFEITKIKAPTLDPRSILFTDQENQFDSDQAITNRHPENGKADVYVNQAAELFVATPFDPVYILVPLLDPSIDHSDGDQLHRGQFHSYDDYLEEPSNDDRHLHYVLSDASFRPRLAKAMESICELVTAGDETMYRLDFRKLGSHVLAASRRAEAQGLPSSLEERFVTRVLEAPIVANSEQQNGSINSTSISGIQLAHDVTHGQLYHLQRLRTAMSFIKSSYLSPEVASKIDAEGLSPELVDFRPLDEYLEKLGKLRTEVLASRSVSDFNKKRLGDDEAAESRAEKKQRQDEEEKKKKSQESRGVRDLKKVNVAGMKKMSDFFGKKAPTAKPKA